VFLVNRLGDQLITLPALRALSALFPGGLQLLLGEGMSSFFYRGLPIGEPVRVRWKDHGAGHIDASRTSADANPCDLFLCLSAHASRTVRDLADTMGARLSVGYAPGLDHQMEAASATHAFDQAFAVARQVESSLGLEDYAAPPVFSAPAEAAAGRLAAGIVGSRERILFVHPETGPERTWPRERFAWVIERFLEARPDYVVIASSLEPFDLGINAGRIRRIDEHLELTLALMRHVDLFLGIDSCFLHAADLFRVPGVALFGPTKPWRWGFRLSPGGRHVAAEAMDEIRPEPVLDALLGAAQTAGRRAV